MSTTFIPWNSTLDPNFNENIEITHNAWKCGEKYNPGFLVDSEDIHNKGILINMKVIMAQHFDTQALAVSIFLASTLSLTLRLNSTRVPGQRGKPWEIRQAFYLKRKFLLTKAHGDETSARSEQCCVAGPGRMMLKKKKGRKFAVISRSTEKGPTPTTLWEL